MVDAYSVSQVHVSFTQVFYNKAVVRQVDVPSSTGNFGILAAHVPLLAVLKPGVVTVIGEDGTKKFFGMNLILFYLLTPFSRISNEKK